MEENERWKDKRKITKDNMKKQEVNIGEGKER